MTFSLMKSDSADSDPTPTPPQHIAHCSLHAAHCIQHIQLGQDDRIKDLERERRAGRKLQEAGLIVALKLAAHRSQSNEHAEHDGC